MDFTIHVHMDAPVQQVLQKEYYLVMARFPRLQHSFRQWVQTSLEEAINDFMDIIIEDSKDATEDSKKDAVEIWSTLSREDKNAFLKGVI